MALFELEIQVVDSDKGLYSVDVEGGQNKPDPVKFDDTELDRPFGKIKKPKSQLYARETGGGLLPFTDFKTQESVCVEIGKRLFKKFFVDSVGASFQRYKKTNYKDEKQQPPRLVLRLPAELYHLPWELLHDPADEFGQFLSVQGSVIRSDAETPTRLFNPLKASSFLFVLASPQDKRAIADFTLEDVEQFRFVRVAPPTYSNFQDLIKEMPHFGLVFFGHGDTDSAQYGRLIFVREDRQWLVRRWLSDPKYGHSLGDAFGPTGGVRLACIFACESAWADKTVEFDKSIVGACLRRTKLAFVLGAQTPLDVFASQECLAGLLKGLAAGDPLDLALGRGRVAIRGMAPEQPGGLFGRMDWWIPVLYSKTTNLDVLPKAPIISSPEGLPKDAVPLTNIPVSPKSLGEATDIMKAVGQKLTHILSGESNRLRDI